MPGVKHQYEVNVACTGILFLNAVMYFRQSNEIKLNWGATRAKRQSFEKITRNSETSRVCSPVWDSVARGFIFKPKVPIWVNFVVLWN
jgi:hypothetical protein